MFDKDPDFEAEALGERPVLCGHESLVMDLYVRLRSATPSDRSVDPCAFLTLFERLNGPSDVELVLDELAALDGVFAEDAKAVRERRQEEIAAQAKAKGK